MNLLPRSPEPTFCHQSFYPSSRPASIEPRQQLVRLTHKRIRVRIPAQIRVQSTQIL